jgi:Amt family ammonium transporter
MAPHSLTLTMVGASLLWVGWFGFNAGSNLEANGTLPWPSSTPGGHRRRHAGLDASARAAARARPRCWVRRRVRWPAWWRSPRPAASSASWAIVIGLLAGVVCLWGVNGLKRLLGATTRSTCSACTASAASSARC